MINPLSFMMDVVRHDHWHICGDNGPLCGAKNSETGWQLPDEQFMAINLCLDCWERLSTPFCDGGCDGMNEEWFAVSDCCSVCGLPIREF